MEGIPLPVSDNEWEVAFGCWMGKFTCLQAILSSICQNDIYEAKEVIAWCQGDSGCTETFSLNEPVWTLFAAPEKSSTTTSSRSTVQGETSGPQRHDFSKRYQRKYSPFNTAKGEFRIIPGPLPK